MQLIFLFKMTPEPTTKTFDWKELKNRTPFNVTSHRTLELYFKGKSMHFCSKRK